jgi:NAD+ synthase
MTRLNYPPPVDPLTALRITDLFIKDEIDKAGKEKLVVGLSGGVDSALSAVLAARAIGADRLVAVKMPYRTSNPASGTHADLLIEKFGLRSLKVEISPMVDAYFESGGDADAVRRGNFMARVRMAVLFDLSAKHNALVLGTGNKSEALMGYTTLYGDSACGLNPIGDLYKTQVFELARFLEIPEEIVSKAPSADLWPGQTDEGEMGILYSEADAILFLLVDENLGREETARILKIPVEKVEKVWDKVEKSRFKRKLPNVAVMPLPLSKSGGNPEV